MKHYGPPQTRVVDLSEIRRERRIRPSRLDPVIDEANKLFTDVQARNKKCLEVAPVEGETLTTLNVALRQRIALRMKSTDPNKRVCEMHVSQVGSAEIGRENCTSGMGPEGMVSSVRTSVILGPHGFLTTNNAYEGSQSRVARHRICLNAVSSEHRTPEMGPHLG